MEGPISELRPTYETEFACDRDDWEALATRAKP
jgi:hypothetical protein